MKKIPNWILIVLAITLLIASKFIFFKKEESAASAAGKSKNNLPVAVNYIVAKQSTFENEVFTTGKAGAVNEVTILPEVSGKVKSILFNEGENVNKGTLLAELNNDDLQAQVSKIKTQIELSEKKLARLKKLLGINGVSQEEYDMQQNELSILQSEQTLVLEQLRKTKITAPFDGVIGLKNISVGAFVTPNTAIVSLVQLQPLYIEFSLPEKYSGLIAKNMEVKFSLVNTIDSKVHPATIYAIEPRIDETTKTIKARALFKGTAPLYPGSFVKVYLSLNKNENVILLPTQSIIATLKGQKVMLSRNNTAVEAFIKTGIRSAEYIQVLEGVTEGDTVITTGLMAVKKDALLKLLKAQH